MFHLSGDSIQWAYNGADSLVISPHTHGDHEFHVLATGEFSHRGRNIELNVQSQTYEVIFTKLFYNLGGPAPGLAGSLETQTAYSDATGLMQFEFANNTLTGNENIVITNPNEGSIQDGTGRFYNMEFQINPDVIDTVMTITDPFDSTYYADFPYDHLLQALSHHFATDLYGISEEENHYFLRQGDLENGQRFITGVYSPEHFTDIEYREEADSLITHILEPSFFNFSGDFNNPARLELLPLGDQYLTDATNNGHVFDYSETGSHTENNYDGNTDEGLLFIKSSAEFIKNNIGEINGGASNIRRHMAKELFRGHGALRATPGIAGTTQDIMNGGELQDHNIAELYLIHNLSATNFRIIQDFSEILPYIPD